MPKAKSASTGKGGDGSKRRTRRACDRCRLKKAKCDGALKCRTCKAGGSVCAYTARRGREARSYYCQMRDVMDEALQRLYWACRQKENFPGDVPDESPGTVTTDAILTGLHLSGPALDGPLQTGQATGDLEHDDTYHQMITSVAEPDSRSSNNTTSHSQSSPASPSTYSQRLIASPSLNSQSENEPNFNMHMDMHPQTRQLSSHVPARGSIHKFARLDASTESSAHSNHAGDPYLDVDAFLDTSSCTVPAVFRPSDDFAAAMLWDTGSSRSPHFLDQQSLAGAVDESYLAPWPGSLAAAYQSVLAV
ncbi:hypothetical protein EDD37DRAFT_309136 [Exophiala viscosa]|uniref:uncharacterized protein n=1 Tax=Exophiala viscosa TaxID=2486360 RepID=UPI00219DD63C|nr:hypothetical protein EDD37DRAFT_309136 [Exophiala viscosa]